MIDSTVWFWYNLVMFSNNLIKFDSYWSSIGKSNQVTHRLNKLGYNKVQSSDRTVKFNNRLITLIIV